MNTKADADYTGRDGVGECLCHFHNRIWIAHDDEGKVVDWGSLLTEHEPCWACEPTRCVCEICEGHGLIWESPPEGGASDCGYCDGTGRETWTDQPVGVTDWTLDVLRGTRTIEEANSYRVEWVGWGADWSPTKKDRPHNLRFRGAGPPWDVFRWCHPPGGDYIGNRVERPILNPTARDLWHIETGEVWDPVLGWLVWQRPLSNFPELVCAEDPSQLVLDPPAHGEHVWGDPNIPAQHEADHER